MSNVTRVKKGESIFSSKVFLTCTITIFGLWSPSGTGEEWPDDDNSVTSADAQAFKRAWTTSSSDSRLRQIIDIQRKKVHINIKTGSS